MQAVVMRRAGDLFGAPSGTRRLRSSLGPALPWRPDSLSPEFLQTSSADKDSEIRIHLGGPA